VAAIAFTCGLIAALFFFDAERDICEWRVLLELLN
jgi:hypothetical protein